MNALRIGERPVRGVMVDAEEIVALATTAGTAENFRRTEEHPHTRYPPVGEALTEFKGVVYFPVLARHRDELTAGEVDFAEFAANPMTLGPETTVSDVIDQFQVENQELAPVLEGGEVVGMVTDLLESITGEIQDPIDAN